MPPRSITLHTRNAGRKTPAARTRGIARATVAQQSDSGTSVGESTYRRVRADIVRGRLAPGQKLTLDRMRDAYGTAVSTLRELLNRLASEGLILAEGSRGFEVASISAANLREIADMRQLLECHALRVSFESGDVEWEGRVVAAHHKLASMEKRMAAGDLSQEEIWRRYDREFHQALTSACGSQVLLDTYAAVYDKYLRYLMIAAVFRGEAAAAEHRALSTFALARDWRSAQTTIITHIQDCVAQMLAGGLVE
jgi:DNA-binding GntR family transcriptional regulator